MDSNNCLQYRVTGGGNGAGTGGSGTNNSSGAGDGPYRGVPSSNGDNNANTNTNGPTNSSALSNVRFCHSTVPYRLLPSNFLYCESEKDNFNIALHSKGCKCSTTSVHDLSLLMIGSF